MNIKIVKQGKVQAKDTPIIFRGECKRCHTEVRVTITADEIMRFDTCPAYDKKGYTSFDISCPTGFPTVCGNIIRVHKNNWLTRFIYNIFLDADHDTP